MTPGSPDLLGDELAEIETALGPLASRDVAIGPLTTYRVGGAARLFAEPRDGAELRRVAETVAGRAVHVLVLGKGSNLLVADAGFEGLCVQLGEGFVSIDVDGTDVRAGGATAYPVLARRLAAAGVAGMEWAVGVPGSVGGAVRMNAGGHGAETADSLVSAELLSMATGEERLVTAAGLSLSYRHSAVGPADVVLAARFGLAIGTAEESQERISQVVRWRRENQPGGQNAGSVFTNPPGDSAGRLIDEAGLKGHRLGTAAVSAKHANFIQADPGGSADDVRRLIDYVAAVVGERTGVELQIELRMVGWDPSVPAPRSVMLVGVTPVAGGGVDD